MTTVRAHLGALGVNSRRLIVGADTQQQVPRIVRLPLEIDAKIVGGQREHRGVHKGAIEELALAVVRIAVGVKIISLIEQSAGPPIGISNVAQFPRNDAV